MDSAVSKPTEVAEKRTITKVIFAAEGPSVHFDDGSALVGLTMIAAEQDHYMGFTVKMSVAVGRRSGAE
jgi:hypothetical protein